MTDDLEKAEYTLEDQKAKQKQIRSWYHASCMLNL